MKRCVCAIGLLCASMVIVSLFSGVSYGSVIGTVKVGSSGTVTTTFNSLTFNPDSAAIGTACPSGGSPCNNDVTSGTVMSFAGCSGVLDSAGCLATREGLTVGVLSAASINPAATYISFASHPNLDFSLNNVTIYGPGTPNPGVTTDCSSISIGGTCVIYPGAAVLLLEDTSTTTRASVAIQGKASDTGTSGLLTGNPYNGGWNVTLTDLLPNGQLPTPKNIQLFFCGTNTVTSASQCNNGASLNTSNSGSFTVSAAPTVPEPESIILTMIGSCLIGLGVWRRRKVRV